MLCSVLRRAGKLRTLGNCPRLRARAGADRRQVTRQSIPVIFKIYEVLSLALQSNARQTPNRTILALVCWLARTGWARSAWRPATRLRHQSGQLDRAHPVVADRPSLLSRGTAWRFGFTVRSGHRSALRNAVQGKRPGGHIAACGLAWLNRTRPDRRISLPSSVSVPRSKLRNRIAQLPSSRWASAIVSFRNASDR